MERLGLNEHVLSIDRRVENVLPEHPRGFDRMSTCDVAVLWFE